MDVKLVILLCVASVAFASAFYNHAPVGYNPYYSLGGYPIETQEEYEYYDNSFVRAPVAAAYSVAQQNQLPFGTYNTRVVSPALHSTAAPVASNVQVTSVPVQAVSTTPIPLTNVNVASHQQQQPVVPVVSTTVAPIISNSNQLGLVYPPTDIVPAVSTYDVNNVVATSNIGNVNYQSLLNPTVPTPVVHSTTHNPIVTNNVAGSGISNYGTINLPAFVAVKSNVVPYPYFNPHLNNIVSPSGYNFALNQGTNYNVVPTLIKSNISSIVPYVGSPGVFVSTPSPLSQNVYVPVILNQALNNGHLYSSATSKSNNLQASSEIFNPPLYQSTPNPPIQSVFGSGSSFASSLSQSQLFPTGNLVSSVPASSAPVNVIAAPNPFNSVARVPQPVITSVSPTDASNIISYSTTTPRTFDGFVPVTSTYTSVKKQTFYAAPPVSQPNAPYLYYTGNASPVAYNANSNTLLQNSVLAKQRFLYTSTPVSTLSPLVSHNGTPDPVIYSTTPTSIITTIPASTSTTQESFSQITSTPRPTVITTQKPSSSTTYITNQSTKVVKTPITAQAFNNYALQTTVPSTITLHPSTIQNTESTVSFSTGKSDSTQTLSYVPSSLVTKPTTTLVTNPTVTSTTQSSTVKYPLKPASTVEKSSTAQSSFLAQTPTVDLTANNFNSYVGSSSIYNKDIQSTYTTPASVSTTSYVTPSSFATPKPTVSYNTVNRQDAFTAGLSGFSKPSTYKPSVTNNYVGSSSIYNKGIQSTYTTPASVSTTSYVTPSSFATPKPTVSYNSVNRQDAFTAALSGFSKPTTYKPPVTNNFNSYVGSSSIYNKDIQSTYTTPESVSTTSYITPSSFATPKPTVSYNTVNRQDAVTAGFSGFSKPSTYKPSVTNNYVGSSSIYNKGIQSTYTKPASVSTTSYVTPSSFATPKPTVSYNSVNRQDAFTAALSGFSKPTTYKPPVTNNFNSYVGSSSIYNKDIQSTYTTPASVSTTSYITPSSFATPKPTVSYNTVNRQDAFTAGFSGFSKPSTFKPSVTNNYVGSSSIYNKGIQSTYTKPASVSTTSYVTPSSFATPKPTVSYNSVNRQDAFTAALSGFSKPTTYKPPVTNNFNSYVGSSSIYNKDIQSTYTTPASVSTTSYITPSSFATPKPTVSYNTVNRQDAFTAALSGFSKPTIYKPSVTNNYVSSTSIYNKGIPSTFTTPATYSTASYTSQYSFPTQKPAVSYNNVNRHNAFAAALAAFSKPTTYKPYVTNNYDTSSIYNKETQNIYTTPATYSTPYNSPSSSVTTIKNPITQSTNNGFVKTTSYPSTFKFNSFTNQANSIYQSNLAKPKYTAVSSTINKSYNQYVPFVNIPASMGHISSSSVSNEQKKEFIPVVSNYLGGFNAIIQPPITSESQSTNIPSTLDNSFTLVSQSTPPPEAVSNFVHSNKYLPPVLPTVSDVGSNGVVTYVSEPVVTSSVATPLVVSTTPRTLPLSYASPALEEKVVAYTNQGTVKPVVYSTTPIITKVDSSPTLTPVSYIVPVSSEYAQASSENPLVYSAAPEVTTVNYV